MEGQGVGEEGRVTRREREREAWRGTTKGRDEGEGRMGGDEGEGDEGRAGTK